MVAAVAAASPGGFAPFCPGVTLSAVDPRDTDPRDRVTIVSPYSVPRTTSTAVGAYVLPAAPQQAEEPATRLSMVERIAVAGLGGIALIGAFGLGGCAAPPTQVQQSQSVTINIDSNGTTVTTQDGRQVRVTPQNAGAANAGAANAGATNTAPSAASTQGTTTAGDNAQADTAAATGPIRVMGQTVVDGSGRPGEQWKTYRGTHRGQEFEFQHPDGWRVARILNGFAVINPQKPQEFVAFQWRMDQGNITNQQLLEMVMNESLITNVRVINQQTYPVRPTSMGRMHSVDTDLAYTNEDGVSCRGKWGTTLTNSDGLGYLPTYQGAVIITQSTATDYNQDMPTLQRIVQSMTAK